MLEEPHNRCSE